MRDNDDALRTIVIGCSPSSGSTLLADLLDSAPGVLCPPELNIFCVPDAYSFTRYFRKAVVADRSFMIRSPTSARSRFFNQRYLAQVGLSRSDLVHLVERATSLPGFVQDFVARYSEYRQRPCHVFVEKTPENIGCFELALHMSGKCWVVHIVRDGRAVVGSLVRRGYSLYESVMIWLRNLIFFESCGANPRTAIIRYEDLVEKPYQTVAELLRAVDWSVVPEDVEKGYLNNRYRAGLPRVASWRARSGTPRVFRGLGFDNDVNPGDVALMESVALWFRGRRLVGFGEALTRYGYPLLGGAKERRRLQELEKEYEAYGRIRAFNVGYRLALD